VIAEAIRRSPLADYAERLTTLYQTSGGSLSIRELPFLTQINLRVDSGDAAVMRRLSDSLGSVLPMTPNTVTLAGDRRALWLGPDEWLVVDGVISDSPALSAHPRTLGVVKSHGAQYFEGAELERALTLPADHRTGVFCPKSRGARREIHSWYLRLWPWEGNDLLYGLVRLEARAHPDTVALLKKLGAE